MATATGLLQLSVKLQRFYTKTPENWTGQDINPLLGSLCQSCNSAVSLNMVRCNSNTAAITRVHRKHYPKMYPTLVVLPDGSTINIRHKEPRKIIQLPTDIATLSGAEKAARLAKRKPKTRIIVEEEIEDTFDSNRYSHLWKK